MDPLYHTKNYQQHPHYEESTKMDEERAEPISKENDAYISAGKCAQSRETGIFFDDTNIDLDCASVGGKAVNMQKLGRIEGITVPRWLVLSTQLFHEFLYENNLLPTIYQLDQLCQNPNTNASIVQTTASTLRSLIITTPLNKKIFLKIKTDYEKLCKNTGKMRPSFAVRSSGIIEDIPESSYAGLFDTILNVCEIQNIVAAIQSVWASSFYLRVVQERIRLNIKQTQCHMGVILQEQIDPRASGVVSTCVLSNHYSGIQISGNYGLGESVVSGEVFVDGWVIHPTEGYILEEIKGNKEWCHRLTGNNGVEKTNVTDLDKNAFALNRDELATLTTQAKKIQTDYKHDVDIEYAIDQNNNFLIVQARPLVEIQINEMQVIDLKNVEEFNVIAKGHFSVAGVASGRLVFVESLDQLEKGEIILDSQDIVLAYVTTNVWSQYLGNIRGLITREGSPSSHPILLSREKHIPCVIGVVDLFEQLITRSGQIVTIDGFNKCIYLGNIDTKKANPSDLLGQFESVSVRDWPDLSTTLPHLLHNQMAVEYEQKYWRRTPTYPVVGFQQELNMMRFDLIPDLLQNQEIKILSKVIDGYTCCQLTPFSDYVSLFKDFDTDKAMLFNETYQSCIQTFMDVSTTCMMSKKNWESYINTYARFRSFIWLGDALRSYAQRKIEEIGTSIHLPLFYLEECSQEIQATIEEMDTEMHRELYELASQFQTIPPFERVETLQIQCKELYEAIKVIGKKYRFEHAISLDKELDLNVVYMRVKEEIDAVGKGKIFSTDKKNHLSRTILPEMNELRAWLRISIWNRILQSNSHHIDARSKEVVRPKLIRLGDNQVQKNHLKCPENIFSCSTTEIGQFLQEIR